MHRCSREIHSVYPVGSKLHVFVLKIVTHWTVLRCRVTNVHAQHCNRPSTRVRVYADAYARRWWHRETCDSFVSSSEIVCFDLCCVGSDPHLKGHARDHGYVVPLLLLRIFARQSVNDWRPISGEEIDLVMFRVYVISSALLPRTSTSKEHTWKQQHYTLQEAIKDTFIFHITSFTQRTLYFS